MKTLELDILEHDTDALAHNWANILTLIERNPFSERMKFLLEHQDLFNKPVLNLAGELEPPNCHGTAFWVAGVSKLNYPYQANEDELNEHMKPEERGESDESRWRVCNPHIERRIPGAFSFSFDYNAGWHSGIYLGKIENEHIFFAQHGTHRGFGPESLRCYTNPTYYIPRSLKK